MGSICRGVGTGALVCTTILLSVPHSVDAAYHFSDYRAHPPIHMYATSDVPQGITPSEIKKIYGLPESGGMGTIAIVGAYNDVTI